jgi:hypothetical protein
VSSNQLLAFLFGHTHGRLAGRRWLVFRYSGNELLIHRKPPSRAIYSPDYEASRPPVFRSGRSDHDQRAPRANLAEELGGKVDVQFARAGVFARGPARVEITT